MARRLYYLRARYYDPATGQFLTRDLLSALTQQPYSYASDNPLNWTDPLGLWDWDLTSTIMGGVSTVTGIAAVALTVTGVGVETQEQVPTLGDVLFQLACVTSESNCTTRDSKAGSCRIHAAL